MDSYNDNLMRPITTLSIDEEKQWSVYIPHFELIKTGIDQILQQAIESQKYPIY